MVALESLNELVEAHPKFIKPIFENLLMIYAEIMEAAGLLVNLRSTALAGILILCNQHHTLVRKCAYFKNKMVPSYMSMLAEINETNIEEWAEELIDEVISKNDIAMSTE
jgi:importin-5